MSAVPTQQSVAQMVEELYRAIVGDVNTTGLSTLIRNHEGALMGDGGEPGLIKRVELLEKQVEEFGRIAKWIKWFAALVGASLVPDVVAAVRMILAAGGG